MTMMCETKNVDVIRKILGNGGRWQLRAIFLIYLVKIPSSWFMACVIFTAPTPWFGEYFCSPSPNDLVTQIDEVNSVDWIKAANPVVVDYHKEYIDVCQIYTDATERFRNLLNQTIDDEETFTKNNSGLVQCHDFKFLTKYDTVVSKFGLVCDKNYLVSLTQSFHLLGVLLGVIISNELLKHHNPRSVMMLGMVLQIMFGCLTGLVPYWFHAALRTVDAICCVLMYAGGSMIFSDITDGKWRLTAVSLFETFWSTGLILLPIIGYFFQTWDQIYYAISLPTLILILLHRWIPNSPTWLLKHNQYDEAKQILLEAAEYNGKKSLITKDFDDLLQLQMKALKAEKPPAAWKEIWESKRTTINLICVHLSQAVSISLYYAILLNISVYGRELLYVNTITAGVFEIIGALTGYGFIMKTKRKWQWTGLLNVAGGLLFLTGWIYTFDETKVHEKILLILTSMVAKAAISCSLSVMAGCTIELVTGNRKKTAAYSVLVFSRVILLAGPFIGASWFYFGRMSPPTLMGGLTIFNGLLNLAVVPEPSNNNTLNQDYESNYKRKDLEK